MSNQIETPNIDESRNPPIMVNLEYKNNYIEYANPQNKEGVDKEKVFFSRMVDLFMFALVHGFKEGLRKPLTKEKYDIFKWSNFKEGDIILIKAVCLLDKNREGQSYPDIINSKSDMVTIIQEYANGGFEDLIFKLQESLDTERNVMDLLVEELEK